MHTKIFGIPIIDDTVKEGNEVFKLKITNVTGGATIGTRWEGTIVILDDESDGGATMHVSGSRTQPVVNQAMTVTASGSGLSFQITTPAGNASLHLLQLDGSHIATVHDGYLSAGAHRCLHGASSRRLFKARFFLSRGSGSNIRGRNDTEIAIREGALAGFAVIISQNVA
ncbi:MAG: hypothetical protein GF398_05960, partial [Chitinivibrionales bacterium]|nr:hypothetical protein [Chitinivibrionales bacterium]